MNRSAATEPDAVRSLASRVMLACGHSRILQVGCGRGALVQALLALGCDAHGVDEKKPPAASNRFATGSILKLPFPKGSFDAVLATHVLEKLDEPALTRVVGELHRVSRQQVLVQVRTGRTPGSSFPEPRDRNWWETLFFAQGFRKALLATWLQDFESLENEPAEILIALEKIPAAALRRHPLTSLAGNRDLHWDVLRESGRRSEACQARYHLAAQFVRKNDRVLDAACGLGYGTAILRAGTLAASVTGVDAAKSAITYARACYDGSSAPVKFQQLTLPKLAGWADDSVDLVVSFETVEHLKDPKAFLAEIHRVLTPGGRFICSVPNLWVDETGKDPNPHHCHVFDFERIRQLVSSRFHVERIVAQTAGGGMVLTGEPRRMRAVHEQHLTLGAAAPDISAEWWLVVGMKDPWQKPLPSYEERLFPEGGANPPNYLSFGRDYQNPWLLRSMVTIGARASSDRLLKIIADETLKKSAPDSADRGAALCVLLYRQIEQSGSPSRETKPLIQQAKDYTQADTSTNPHVLRWKISLQFALGLLHIQSGALPEALRQLEKCAQADCREFSHLLATKCVRAAHLAALLHLSLGQPDESRRLWRMGLATAHRVFSGSLLQSLGNLDVPPDFALRELTQVLDFAQQCAVAINLEARAATQRPLYSRLITECLTDEVSLARQSLRQCQDWNRRLAEGNDWQAAQNKSLAAQLKEAVPRASAQKLWITQLKDANAWLEKQLATLKPRQAEVLQRHEQMRAWIEKLTEAKRWFEEQNTRLAGELKSTQTRLAQATRWFEGQGAAVRSERQNLERQLTELREANQSLIAARDALAEENRQLQAALAAKT